MKKIFVKLAILMLTSAIILPLTACTFNFYINRATTAIAKSFADQTSALLKSLVMSKELNVDTSNTNYEIMNQIKNSSINNLTGKSNLKTWDDLQKKWGYNNIITAEGSFIPTNFFVASGTGSLTNQINSKRKLNETLQDAGTYVKLINILNNNTLAPQFLEKTSSPIIKYLTTLQGDFKDAHWTSQLVANLINNYNDSFLPPLLAIFNNFIYGYWTEQKQTAPTTEKELATFMSTWKDKDNQPYSQWINITNNTWKFNPTMLGIDYHYIKDWKASDYNLYLAGTLINHLFWKISKKQKLFKPDTTPDPQKPHYRYLGEIFGDYLTAGIPAEFDDKGFIKDINQYIPFLIEDPVYLLTLVEALIPIIKYVVIEIPDKETGITNLTIGDPKIEEKNHYPSNLLDISKKIKALFNDKETFKKTIKMVLGSTKTKGKDTLLFDLKFIKGWFENEFSIGAIFNTGLVDSELDPLINTIVEKIPFDQINSIINSVTTILEQASAQYSKGEGINTDLINLQTFLLNKNNGILIIFSTTITQLQKMIKDVHDIKQEEIEALYISLGGVVNKEDPDYDHFRTNSFLDKMQNELLDQKSALTSILNLLFGSPNDNKKLGIDRLIIRENIKWINNNYEKYFDASDNEGINKRIGTTYNINMKKTVINNIETINLKYEFKYIINNKTYHFVITTIDVEDLTTFTGIRNFKFTTVHLRKI